jgi:Ca-activated chloride channel family protein
VTALYEIVPVESRSGEPVASDGSVDALKDQERPNPTPAANSSEWLSVRIRYKAPDGEESELVKTVLAGRPGSIRNASESGRFSAAVALFATLLRDSEFKGVGDYDLVSELAREAVGGDEYGERREFLELVELARQI